MSRGIRWCGAGGSPTPRSIAVRACPQSQSGLRSTPSGAQRRPTVQSSDDLCEPVRIGRIARAARPRNFERGISAVNPHVSRQQDHGGRANRAGGCGASHRDLRGPTAFLTRFHLVEGFPGRLRIAAFEMAYADPWKIEGRGTGPAVSAWSKPEDPPDSRLDLVADDSWGSEGLVVDRDGLCNSDGVRLGPPARSASALARV